MHRFYISTKLRQGKKFSTLAGKGQYTELQATRFGVRLYPEIYQGKERIIIYQTGARVGRPIGYLSENGFTPFEED
jgi:hypothetical protein